MPKALLFSSCLYLPKKDKNTAQETDNFPYKQGAMLMHKYKYKYNHKKKRNLSPFEFDNSASLPTSTSKNTAQQSPRGTDQDPTLQPQKNHITTKSREPYHDQIKRHRGMIPGEKIKKPTLNTWSGLKKAEGGVLGPPPTPARF